jgi:hypothetical protein
MVALAIGKNHELNPVGGGGTFCLVIASSAKPGVAIERDGLLRRRPPAASRNDTLYHHPVGC